jgi:hypothetical protein
MAKASAPTAMLSLPIRTILPEKATGLDDSTTSNNIANPGYESAKVGKASEAGKTPCQEKTSGNPGTLRTAFSKSVGTFLISSKNKPTKGAAYKVCNPVSFFSQLPSKGGPMRPFLGSNREKHDSDLKGTKHSVNPSIQRR